MRLDPASQDYYKFAVGNAYDVMGRYQEAATVLKQHLAMYPNNLVAHLLITLAYVKLGRDQDARAEVAEINRFKGELLLGGAYETIQAEQCFRTAIAVARSQNAKSLELRATMSLARLLRNTSRRDEARTMLADIYNWFTEGFDTADLKDAKALLDELSN